MSAEQDKIFGDINELKVLNYLNELPENQEHPFTIYKNKFSTFDFKNNNGTIAELKSRRCSHSDYPTTMIGYNKIERAENSSEIFKFYFLIKLLTNFYNIIMKI